MTKVSTRFSDARQLLSAPPGLREPASLVVSEPPYERATAPGSEPLAFGSVVIVHVSRVSAPSVSMLTHRLWPAPVVGWVKSCDPVELLWLAERQHGLLVDV